MSPTVFRARGYRFYFFSREDPRMHVHVQHVADFPWFRHASIDGITTVERPSAHHLYWPLLDIDLAVESIEHPDRYPLVIRVAV